MAELEELKKQKICHLKLELPLEKLKRLMEFWFNNLDSDYNLEKNFVALQEKHERYFTLIEEFVQDKLDTPSTLDDLNEALKQLGQAQNKLAEALGKVVLADTIFAYSLDTLIIGLREIKFTLDFIVKESDYPELKNEFEEMQKAIQSWIDKTAYAKAFILEANRKRSLVFGIVRDKLDLHLQSEFARVSGQKLEDLKGQIDAILAARDLLIEIENWWFNAAQSDASGIVLRNRYLQYEKSLFFMRADHAQGASLLERIETLKTTLPPKSKVEVEITEGTLKANLTTLKTQIDELAEGGWQPLFDRQKFLVEARERSTSSLSSGCKAAIEDFKKKASDVQTLLDFRDAEEAFKKHVVACSV
ncbi:hypothetical protein HUN01_00180 (plasmid) [Nostoc edaphicum CCNP1411]|uniref:Uncharacterized protein n=1 Tax=Nostoc edaphicum CCNP1411 TaxID=1472755 RepID=A0A7D7QJG4_9NOSO|nr:hypothetical protein [Nostoc edaphicum]QMS86085.1 hypothetical protein HUN01_00180 [Nostoc edaphicum CCNP1411]